MAGPHTPISLACTNPDGEGAAAAERGDSTIRDHNGQIIHILHSSTKSPPPCQNAGCVIYDRHKQNKIYLVNLPWKIHISFNGYNSYMQFSQLIKLALQHEGAVIKGKANIGSPVEKHTRKIADITSGKGIEWHNREEGKTVKILDINRSLKHLKGENGLKPGESHRKLPKQKDCSRMFLFFQQMILVTLVPLLLNIHGNKTVRFLVERAHLYRKYNETKLKLNCEHLLLCCLDGRLYARCSQYMLKILSSGGPCVPQHWVSCSVHFWWR